MLEIKELVSTYWSKFKIHKKELSWVVMGQFIAFSGSVVGVKLLTNTLGPQGYGELALGMTVALVLQQIFYGPFGQSAFRYYSVYRDKNQLDLFWGVLKKIGLYSGIIFILLSLLVGFLAKIIVSNKWFYLIIFASFFGILDGLNGILSALQNAERQRKIVALFQGLTQWLRPLCGVTAAILFSKNGQTVLAGFCIAMVFITIYQSKFLGNIRFKNGNNSEYVYNKSIYKNLFDYAYPFSLWGIIGWFQLFSDRWALQSFLGESDVGIYTALFQIGSLPIMLSSGVIGQFTAPIIFEKIGDSNDNDKIKTAIRWIKSTIVLFIIIVGISIVIAILAHGQIFQLVVNAKFWRVSNFLPLVCLGIGLRSLGQMLCTVGFALNKPDIYLKPIIISATLTVALNIYLAQMLGIYGVCLSLVISGVCYATWIGIVSYKFLNRKLIMKTT